MLPNVLLAGLPKCGTTALYHWFDQREDVFVPAVKEPHLLSGLSVSGVTDFDSYEALYRGSTSEWRIDCSTSSVLHADRVVANVDRHDVPVTVVLIVYRNPVERFVSHWNYARKIGQDDRTLAAVAESGWMTPGDPWHLGSAYRETGLLGPGLHTLSRRFPCVRVLPYSAMRNDPAAFLAEICRALGIALPAVDVRLEERNVSLRARGALGGSVLRIANVVGAHRVAWPRSVRSIARRLFIAGSTDLAQTVPAEIEDDLNRYFNDDQAEIRRFMVSNPDVFPLPLGAEWIT